MSKIDEKIANKIWKQEPLTEICNITYGKGLPTSKLTETGYPVYGGNGIIGYYSNFLYDTEKVIISCRGVASGKVLYSVPKAYVTSNSLVLNIRDEDSISFTFLLFSMIATDFSSKVTGSAQPQLTIDNIKDIIVTIPDQKTIDDFTKAANKCMSVISNNNKELRVLNKIQQHLLLKLSC